MHHIPNHRTLMFFINMVELQTWYSTLPAVDTLFIGKILEYEFAIVFSQLLMPLPLIGFVLCSLGSFSVVLFKAFFAPRMFCALLFVTPAKLGQALNTFAF